jgi:hypothetical protein
MFPFTVRTKRTSDALSETSSFTKSRVPPAVEIPELISPVASEIEVTCACELRFKNEARPMAAHRVAKRVDFIDLPPKDSFHIAWTDSPSLNMAIFASETSWNSLKTSLIANIFDSFFLFPFSPS